MNNNYKKKQVAYDVIIIGGGLSGLVTANVLSNLGIKSLLLERNSKVGGNNGSMLDPYGNVFDYGYHALDFNRSLLTTKFFKKVLKGQYNKIKLKRGIYIKNFLIPYNSPIKKWPQELQTLFLKSELVDTIKDKPTFKQIKNIYGEKFSKFILKEVLYSYPTAKWILEKGTHPNNVIGVVYPWFFPKVSKQGTRLEEWEIYHDMIRRQKNHYILYPKKGGFGNFVNAIIRDARKNFLNIKTNVKNLKFVLDNNKNIKKIIVDDKSFISELFIWCASPIALSQQISGDKNKKLIGKPQRYIFGNFTFKKELKTSYHEILVASLSHKINRISFPGRLSKLNNKTVQVEYYFPDGEFSLDQKFWKKSWLSDLNQMQIINDNNTLLNFTFLSEIRGFISTKKISSIINDYRKKFSMFDNSNLIIPHYNLGPENINRVIPETIINITNSLKKFNKVKLS